MGKKLLLPGDDEFKDLVHRYEQYLSGNANGYFDVEEFENIAEYYLLRGRTKDSSRAIDFGMKLHPGSTALKAKRAKIYLAVDEVKKAYQLLSSFTES